MPAFTLKRFVGLNRRYRLRTIAAAFLFLALLPACVKSTRVVKTPAEVLQARTLNRQELTQLLQRRVDEVRTLQVASLKAFFSGGDQATGKIESYMGVPGYLLAERPNSLRITLQNPVTKSSLADVASDGKELALWIPSKNKFIFGSVDLERVSDASVAQNPLANLRPQHIVPALLFEPLTESDSEQLVLEEETDGLAKYYILSVLKAGEGRLRLMRRIWIERASLNVRRERYYQEDGVVLSEIRYLRYRDFDGVTLPDRIELQRSLDHYSLKLELERVKVNPPIQPNVFQLNRIPGAELVDLGSRKP
jgi:hypothetical protein